YILRDRPTLDFRPYTTLFRSYQTMLEQITADEMANSVLEDEILEALDKIERAQQAVAVAEANVAKGQAELNKVKAAVIETENLLDRKSTRLNSSHQIISYAVF